MEKYDVLDAYWHDINSIPLLPDEEQQRLSERIKQGDERALEKLVTANLRYVVSVARKVSLDNPEVSIDDLISEGNIALMSAARKWDSAMQPHFISYAKYDVERAMHDAVARQGSAMTLPKNDGAKSEVLRKYSTDAPIHQGQTNTFGDMLWAPKPMTDDEAEDNETNYSILQALRYLEEREKRIIKSFYGIGGEERKTMAEIGNEMNLKRERVRQIRKTAERKMRRIMKHILIVVMAMMCLNVTTVQAAKKKVQVVTDIVDAHGMYVYGVAISAIDTVVYVTDVMELENAQIHLNTKFLVAREELSNQLRNHMVLEGEKNMVCSVSYNKDLKKLTKSYNKLLAYYKKKGFLVKPLDKDHFVFKAVRTEYDERGVAVEEREITVEDKEASPKKKK